METKFKEGSRVSCTENGLLGTVTLVDDCRAKGGDLYYEVKFDNGDEEFIAEEYLEATDEPDSGVEDTQNVMTFQKFGKE